MNRISLSPNVRLVFPMAAHGLFTSKSEDLYWDESVSQYKPCQPEQKCTTKYHIPVLTHTGMADLTVSTRDYKQIVDRVDTGQYNEKVVYEPIYKGTRFIGLTPVDTVEIDDQLQDKIEEIWYELQL